jgi:hypothetical protein
MLRGQYLYQLFLQFSNAYCEERPGECDSYWIDRDVISWGSTASPELWQERLFTEFPDWSHASERKPSVVYLRRFKMQRSRNTGSWHSQADMKETWQNTTVQLSAMCGLNIDSNKCNNQRYLADKRCCVSVIAFIYNIQSAF